MGTGRPRSRPAFSVGGLSTRQRILRSQQNREGREGGGGPGGYPPRRAPAGATRLPVPQCSPSPGAARQAAAVLRRARAFAASLHRGFTAVALFLSRGSRSDWLVHGSTFAQFPLHEIVVFTVADG